MWSELLQVFHLIYLFFISISGSEVTFIFLQCLVFNLEILSDGLSLWLQIQSMHVICGMIYIELPYLLIPSRWSTLDSDALHWGSARRTENGMILGFSSEANGLNSLPEISNSCNDQYLAGTRFTTHNPDPIKILFLKYTQQGT